MTRPKKIIYWISTVILAFGLLASGIQQLLHLEIEGALAPPFEWGIQKLGYPVYLLTILGIWKILGALAILIPKYPLIKEWAYAGIFFLFTGALFSHLASGHAWTELIPATTLLIATAFSWYFRPSDRKFVKSKD
ncbi:DoxX family protein [Gracilimonas sp. BCB1]|uniref:DoxX family protein n=1 Tax=Gracilimonas sp. BCB1 TaxID=3152362 RepID=UPI0032D93E13